MSSLNPDNVFDQFSENIPGASALGEAYLRAIAGFVGQASLPVGTDVAEERVGGGLRAEKQLFLVLTPLERRLRRYPSYHFGKPLGTTLSVGWYLVGKIAAGGLGGWAIAGGADQHAIDELASLMHAVHDMAVVPAMHQIAADAGFTPGGARQRQGFFGTT
jgi:hypothetical protein